MTKRICDLPPDLVGDKILGKVPITSLRQVRSTCKLWDGLTKDWILGKAAARQHQFVGFMTKDFKVCSLRFHLRRKEEEEDLVDPDLPINQVDLLNQVEIDRVFHCDGLLLCIAKDSSRHVVWNPYLGQTRWIGPRTYFHSHDNYALGYDMSRNHKILRFVDDFCFHERKKLFGFEIYDLPSNSWRVLEVIPDWKLDPGHRGVSLKGNTYFWAHEKDIDFDYDDFLLCFDFTTERFGQRLRLPIPSWNDNTVTVSSVRDEKLALLHQIGDGTIKALEIWITTKIEPNAVTWSKFMNVDMTPLIGDRDVWFDEKYGSFFIDEEEKVAVVFDLDNRTYVRDELTKTAHYHTAFIIGDDGYYKTVLLGEAPKLSIPNPDYSGDTPELYSPPLVCSPSYLPCLVQLNQPHKRKRKR